VAKQFFHFTDVYIPLNSLYSVLTRRKWAENLYELKSPSARYSCIWKIRSGNPYLSCRKIFYGSLSGSQWFEKGTDDIHDRSAANLASSRLAYFDSRWQ